MIKKLFSWLKGGPEEINDGPCVPNLSSMEWRTIVKKIAPHIESHIIYLQLGDGSFIKVDEAQEPIEVISVSVAYPIDDVEPWDTEVPAKYMVEKLSKLLNREVLHLINRDPSFNGCHYACIRIT